MSHETTESEAGRIDWRVSAREVGAAGAYVALLTALAAAIWPVWDDGWLDLMRREGGAQGIIDGSSDRPLVAMAWAALERSHLLLASAVGLHFATWGAMAYLTMVVMAASVPPAWHRYRVAVAIAAVSPIYAFTAHTLSNPVIGLATPAVLGIIGALLLMQTRRWVVGSLGLLLMMAASAISEYGVGACAAATVFAVVARLAGGWRVSTLARGAAAAVVTGFGHLLMQRLADYSARDDYSAETMASGLGERLPRLPLRVVAAVWNAAVGALGDATSTAGLSLAANPRRALGSVVIMTLVVGGAFWVSRRRVRESTEVGPTRAGALALLAAVVLTGAMAAVAGRWPGTGLASRIWIPALPFVASFGATLLLWAARARLRAPVALGLLGLAVYLTANAGQQHLARRQFIHQAARAAEPLLDTEGFTLVVVDVKDDDARDYEYTARFRQALGRDVTRLWVATPKLTGVHGLEPGGSLSAATIDRTARRITRRAAITRVLWVEEGPKVRVVAAAVE